MLLIPLTPTLLIWTSLLLSFWAEEARNPTLKEVGWGNSCQSNDQALDLLSLDEELFFIYLNSPPSVPFKRCQLSLWLSPLDLLSDALPQLDLV
jgi:hypothetical protein